MSSTTTSTFRRCTKADVGIVRNYRGMGDQALLVCSNCGTEQPVNARRARRAATVHVNRDTRGTTK